MTLRSESEFSSTDLGSKVLHPFRRRVTSVSSTYIGIGLFLVLVSLTAGSFSYLLIAITLIVISGWFARSSFNVGVLWIVGSSTFLGFFQRLILFSTGQLPSPDYARLALELSILLYTFFVIRSFFSRHASPAKIRLKWLDVFVTAYLGISTLYTFNLIYAEPAITVYGWRWVCIPIFMYYIGRAIGRTPNTIYTFNKFIIILLLLQAGYGAFQSIFGYPAFEQPWVEVRRAIQGSVGVEDSLFIAGKARIPALTDGHTTSGFLIPILFLWTLFTSERFLDRNWKINRRLALLFGLLFLGFSNERSAIGMVGIGLIVAVFLYARKRLGVVVFFLSIPAIALAFVLMSQIDPSTIPVTQDTIVLRRLLELLNPLQSRTFAGRINVYWPIFWEFLAKNPLGYGLGTFHETTVTLGTEWGRSPHNMYLQIVLETGVAGLAMFVAIIISYLSMLYKYGTRLPVPDAMHVVLGAATTFVAFLAIGVANLPIETFPLAIQFWLSVGLVTSYLTEVRNKVLQRKT